MNTVINNSKNISLQKSLTKRQLNILKNNNLLVKGKKNLYYEKNEPTVETIYKLPVLTIKELIDGITYKTSEENNILKAYNEKNYKRIHLSSFDEYKKRYNRFCKNRLEKIDIELTKINSKLSYKSKDKLKLKSLIMKKIELEESRKKNNPLSYMFGKKTRDILNINNKLSNINENILELITKEIEIQKEQQKNLQIIDYFINELKEIQEQNKVKNIIASFENIIKESNTLPHFIDNSFKTRKTIPRFVRKNNIKINSKNQNLKTQVNDEFKKYIIDIINIETREELKNKLGLDKINSITKYNNLFNTNSDKYNDIKDNILNFFLEYFIDPENDILDPTYNNNTILDEHHPKLKEAGLNLRRKNNLLVKITKELLLMNSDTENIYPNSSIEPIAHGLSGKVYSINKKNSEKKYIYKYETSRFRRKSTNFLKNRTGIKNEIKVPYLFNNFIPSVNLIGFFIQNYLCEIDRKYRNISENKERDTYVPDVLNYSICYNQDVILTVMESAFEINNNTLLDFIIAESHRNTFVIDLINIIIKLCEILDFYQQKCCFVHHDLHSDNIMISYRYDEGNSKLKFELRIIDISSRSSIVIKYNNAYKLLKHYDIWYSATPESVNPFLSGMWNKYDLFYLVLYILFYKERTTTNKKLPTNIQNFKNFINVLLFIFDIKDNYNEILNSIEKDTLKIKYYSMIATKEEREKLFNDKTNIYLFFIPLFLKKFLEELVVNISFNPQNSNEFISLIPGFRIKYLQKYNKINNNGKNNSDIPNFNKTKGLYNIKKNKNKYNISNNYTSNIIKNIRNKKEQLYEPLYQQGIGF